MHVPAPCCPWYFCISTRTPQAHETDPESLGDHRSRRVMRVDKKSADWRNTKMYPALIRNRSSNVVTATRIAQPMVNNQPAEGPVRTCSSSRPPSFPRTPGGLAWTSEWGSLRNAANAGEPSRSSPVAQRVRGQLPFASFCLSISFICFSFKKLLALHAWSQ